MHSRKTRSRKTVVSASRHEEMITEAWEFSRRNNALIPNVFGDAPVICSPHDLGGKDFGTTYTFGSYGGLRYAESLFRTNMRELSKIAGKSDIDLQGITSGGRAAVWGFGLNHFELEHTQRKFRGLDRVYGIEPRGTPINTALQLLTEGCLRKIVFVQSDATDLRWGIPDDYVNLNILNHLLTTNNMDHPTVQGILGEAARISHPRSLTAVIDMAPTGHSPPITQDVEDRLSKAGFTTIHQSKHMYLGSPNIGEILKRK